MTTPLAASDPGPVPGHTPGGASGQLAGSHSSALAPVAVHQDEVLTGEAVALDVQPVGFFMRALGTIIDALVSIAAFLLLLWVIAAAESAGILAPELFPILTVTLLVLILVVLPTAVETASRGRSLGRLAVGARIVRSDGGASGFRQAFIRALLGVLEIWFTFGGLAALVGAFTPRSQRLGDLVAGTYSERTRTPALAPTAVVLPAALAGWATVADVARMPERLARRVAQFAAQADRMQPAARERVAASLAAEVRPHVSPLPPVAPELLLRGVVAVRRERELRALQLENARVAGLLLGGDSPRGFPQR